MSISGVSAASSAAYFQQAQNSPQAGTSGQATVGQAAGPLPLPATPPANEPRRHHHHGGDDAAAQTTGPTNAAGPTNAGATATGGSNILNTLA